MLNINPNTIENVSIKDLKETEEVLKLYNNHINKSEEDRKTAVLSESKGRISQKAYDEHIERARSFTLDGSVPNPTEWQQIRTQYREVGNQKIADARTRLEKLSEEYSGTATVDDERYGKITPKQAVKNYDIANKHVETTKKMAVVLALGFGLLGFLGLLLVVKLVLNDLLLKNSLMVLQMAGGLAGILGLVIGGWLGSILVKSLLGKQKEERDYFEMVKINNQVVITKLQTEIKIAEENIKRVEAQYGVEILAKTDFSSQVTFVKKPIVKEEKKKQEKPKPIAEVEVKEEDKTEENTTKSDVQSNLPVDLAKDIQEVKNKIKKNNKKIKSEQNLQEKSENVVTNKSKNHSKKSKEKSKTEEKPQEKLLVDTKLTQNAEK